MSQVIHKHIICKVRTYGHIHVIAFHIFCVCFAGIPLGPEIFVRASRWVGEQILLIQVVLSRLPTNIAVFANSFSSTFPISISVWLVSKIFCLTTSVTFKTIETDKCDLNYFLCYFVAAYLFAFTTVFG